VDWAGLIDCEPLGCTAPTVSILVSVALVVSQVSVVDWPLSIVLGFAVSEAVGAAGGGGGGGGGGAGFFLQAPSIMIAPNANTNVTHFSFRCFTFSLPEDACPHDWRTAQIGREASVFDFQGVGPDER